MYARCPGKAQHSVSAAVYPGVRIGTASSFTKANFHHDHHTLDPTTNPHRQELPAALSLRRRDFNSINLRFHGPTTAMRFLGSLLATGLSTIVVATASSLPSCDFSSVYYKLPSDSSSPNTEIPNLTTSQFTLALAHRLGLSQFHSLSEQDDVDAINKIDSVLPTVELFGGNGKGKLVVHITGVDRELFSDIKPTFNVASKSARIDPSIFKHAEAAIGAKLKSEWVSSPSAESDGGLYKVSEKDASRDRIEVLADSFKYTPEDTEPWSDYVDGELANLAKDNIVSKLDHRNVHHRIFVTGFTSLQDIFEYSAKSAVIKGKFVFIHVPILKWLEPNSEAYAAGVKLISAYLHTLMTTHDHYSIPDITLVVSPSFQHSYTSPHQSPENINSELKKRKEIPISMSSTPPYPHAKSQQQHSSPELNANPPLVSITSPNTRIPHTFKHKEDCQTHTNNCSSHGACVLSNFPIADSWQCRCNATESRTKNGVIKTYWAGNACQKQDISVQFHMIFIFTLLLVGGIAAAIGAMYRMGAEELPGVLTAGMPAKRQ